MSAVGENIKTCRKRLNLSQAKLAELSGISQSAISDIENPAVTKLPNIDTVTRLARALNVGVEELLQEEKENQGMPDDPLIDQIMVIYRLLTPDRRKQLEVYARFLADQK